MRKIFVLLLGISLLTLTGCFDVVEEVFLNRDGSGKYLITMDMSSMLTDPFMKGMMEEALAEQNRGDAAEMEKDTMFYFRELGDEVELSAREEELIADAKAKMTMSQKEGEMLVVMEFPFHKVEDLTEIMKVAEKVGGEDQMGDGMLGGGMMGGGMMPSGGGIFELKRKKLYRLPMPEVVGEDTEMDESMEMMKMFLGTASYKTIYHLPGKVRKTDIPNARIDGNTVTVESSLLDMMDKKVQMDGMIKFR